MNAAERFFSRVQPSDSYDPCWIWRGATTDAGYGLFSEDGVTKCAHRVAYEWLCGPIPHKFDIDHLCRNRACVNPGHLEPVPHRENIRRGWVARRAAA